MKKITCLILVLVLMLSSTVLLLSGCGEEKFDLVYCNWNMSTEAVNNIERRMIAAFEDKYQVNIKIEEAPTVGYDDYLTGLNAKGQMPDVFMMSNLGYGLSNQLLLDLSSIVASDSDWGKIPATVEESVHFGSGIYAIPFAMHLMGYFVNTSLLDDYNVEQLSVAPTYQEFLAVVQEFATKVNEGIIGLSHEATIFEWYPASVDETMGWFSWDGEKYNLNSDAFKEGMQKTADMRSNSYTYDSLSEEVRAEHFEGIDGYTALWNQGRLAIRWGATYEMPDMLEMSAGEFNIKFIGVPGGNTPIVPDYIGISKSCQNVDLAYKLAKWMSFSPEGISKRMELDTSGEEMNTLPLTTTQSVLDAYFDKYTTVSGLDTVFSTIDNGIVEAVKVVPGYTLSRWKAKTGVSVGEVTDCEIGVLLDQCWLGNTSYNDYAAQLNELSNSRYDRTIKNYKSLYGIN